MTITDFYYNFNAGETPEDEEYIIRTRKTFDFLLDGGITEREITDLIVNKFDNKDFLTPEDMPDELWDKSLLKRNTFYYHKDLQILSPPPTLTEVFPFYREMKIRYTEQDILDYFIKTFTIRDEWINVNKEIGSIKYLLDKYECFKFIESVDFILLLIDFVKSKDTKIYKLYDICEYEIELAEMLERDIKNAKLNGKNKIIWR